MDINAMVNSTGCACFATNHEGRIVAWNRTAEEVLGKKADEVLGQYCHEVVGGRDLFGNRFCNSTCSVNGMVNRKEPVHNFRMYMNHSNGRSLTVGMCTVVVRETENSSEFITVHLFQPLDKIHEQLASIQEGTQPGAGRDQAPVAGEPARGQWQAVLTAREMEVLGLLKEGTPTNGIAELLHISVTTVRNHIQGILRKLGAHSRLEAVSIARRRGLI
jgi:PAS domain S-box-containing protein